MMRLILKILLLVALAGCEFVESAESTCESCHRGLELASDSHRDCTACHAGNPDVRDEKASHKGMYGPNNPSDPDHWEKSCGTCHPHQLERMRANLMYTNTGMIKNIQLTWEGDDPRLFATRGQKGHDAEGRPLELTTVRELDNLSGELYRKFCALCHVGIQNRYSYNGSHASGCAACHFPYNENGTYRGGDKTMQGKWPHSATHKMEPLPPNKVCARCHNRSGRIALTYEGLNDGNNGLVPTKDGKPGPAIISGGRNVTRIAPDIHFTKGMDCIDCHTSNELMGDGYVYENMYMQTEVTCENCHGSAAERPRSEKIRRENDPVLRESSHYKQPARYGNEMVLTAKGRKFSNVFLAEGKVMVQGKRSGKLHESKVITGTPEHTIVGHERMECYSCHSHTVVQCYGCHTSYDKSEKGMDFIKGRETPGRFDESEDYRMLYPFPLALNQRGHISTVTPGCQTFVTVYDEQGEKVVDSQVANFRGRRQLRFAPFFGHNSGSKAIGCSECHGNPAFLGFGQHVIEGSSIEGTLLCDKSDSKPLDGFLSMDYGRVRAYSAITREQSRPLNGQEIKKVLAVNLCLVCHSDPKDPIYQKELDYRELENCLSRPMPAAMLSERDGDSRKL